MGDIMGTIYISQRVEINTAYLERRDALDQRWVELLMVEQNVVIPVPNHKENLYCMLKKVPPDFIVLTGGNTPEKYGGDAAERDITDAVLIQYAIDKRIPLLGVCRGMQSIILYYGGTLKKIQNHVSVQHPIVRMTGEPVGVVNSYHNFSCDKIPSILELVIKSEDGEIEAIKSKKDQIYGVMWHPERTKESFEQEIAFLKKIFRN